MTARSVILGPILGLIAIVGCTREPPRNLLFISLDTVRQDHLSVYGYFKETTPQLKAYARRGSIFTNAYAQATLTNPSHGSMFTGLYPVTHGSLSNQSRLKDQQITLAEILLEQGFRTAGFTSGFPLNGRISGLHQGFELYDDELQETEPGGGGLRRYRRTGKQSITHALAWLQGLDKGERFFLFLHLYDAHGPYLPSPEYLAALPKSSLGPALEHVPNYQKVSDSQWPPIENLNQYIDRYDAQLRYLDDQIATLLQGIDLTQTIVVIVGDHGETLGERASTWWALDHGGRVFEEQTRIPLVLLTPSKTPRRITDAVQTVDLFSTLVEMLELERQPNTKVQGQSLVPLLNGEHWEKADRFVFSSSATDPGPFSTQAQLLDTARPTFSIQDRRWKLVTYPGLQNDYLELFDLTEDPAEMRNVGDEYPGIRERLSSALAAHLGTSSFHSDESEPELSAAQQEALQALGYLDN
jgi:arylsulfatase A-like enzyme